MTSRVLSVGCRRSRAVAAGRRTGGARAAGRRPADAVAAAAHQPRRRGPVAARGRAVALQAAPARRAAIAVLDDDRGARAGRPHEPPQRRASPPAQRDQRQPEAVVRRLRLTPNGAQTALEAAEAVGALALAVVAHEVLRERPHAPVSGPTTLRVPRGAVSPTSIRSARSPTARKARSAAKTSWR